MLLGPVLWLHHVKEKGTYVTAPTYPCAGVPDLSIPTTFQQMPPSSTLTCRESPTPIYSCTFLPLIINFVNLTKPKHLVKKYSGHFYEGVFEWRLHLNQNTE